MPEIIRFTRIRPRSLFFALPLLLGFILICRAAPPKHYTGDSLGYLAYSNFIVRGNFFERAASPPEDRFRRPPLYPLLLAASQKLLPASWDATITLHALIGALTLGAVAALMVINVPIVLSGGSVLLTFYLARFYFSLVGTEWIAICLVLVLLAAAYQFLRRGNTGSLLLCTLVASLAVLLRASHIICYSVPLTLFFFQPASWRRSGYALVLGGSPILLCLAVNWFLLGRPFLSAAIGDNIVGPACLIGKASPRPDDPPRFKTFLSELAKQQSTPLPAGALCNQEESPAGTFWLVDYNIWYKAVPIARAMGADPIEADKLMLKYALRVIEDQPGAYLNYVGCMLRRALVKMFNPAALWLYGLSAAPFAAGWYQGGGGAGSFQSGLVCLLALLLHALHMLLCSAVNQIALRYHEMTFFPFLACLTLYAVMYSGVPGMVRRRLPAHKN